MTNRNSVNVQTKIWTLDEAKGVLPQIASITEEAFERVTQLESEIKEIMPEFEQERKEEELEGEIQSWIQEILQIGAEVKGLWLVDFDNGKGYYCWKMGEPDLLFFHGYTEGFVGRRPIIENEE